MLFQYGCLLFWLCNKCLQSTRKLKIPPRAKLDLSFVFWMQRLKPSKIHRQIYEIYVRNAMSDLMVTRWVRQFNERRENMHTEKKVDVHHWLQMIWFLMLKKKLEKKQKIYKFISFNKLFSNFTFTTLWKFEWKIEHNEPRSHTVHVTKQLLQDCGLDKFDRHPYSLFSGQHFEGDQEVKEAVPTWLTFQTVSFCGEDIKEMVPRYYYKWHNR